MDLVHRMEVTPSFAAIHVTVENLASTALFYLGKTCFILEPQLPGGLDISLHCLKGEIPQFMRGKGHYTLKLHGFHRFCIN